MELRGHGCVSFKRQALKKHFRSRVWDQGLILLTQCSRGADFRSGDRADPESGGPRRAHTSRPWPWPWLVRCAGGWIPAPHLLNIYPCPPTPQEQREDECVRPLERKGKVSISGVVPLLPGVMTQA